MYFPLELIEHMSEIENSETMLNLFKHNRIIPEDATAEELFEYSMSADFFSKTYNGKFKKLNDMMLYNKEINQKFHPMMKFSDFESRSTEWKDILTTVPVVERWAKYKMAYKVDNDFFHEIIQTENAVVSKEMFKNLPFDCFFIDLTDVKGIADFKGVFVYLHEDKGMICLNTYMVRSVGYTFFSYYSWYNFNIQDEIEWQMDDLPEADFVARSIEYNENAFVDNGYVDIADTDPRNSIVMAVCQLLMFIALDASDIEENANTKQTYRPRKEGARIKNKFSEVRMWDVGVRYGKAIRVAKQQFNKAISELSENENSDGSVKNRKPMRPHIRRPHWQRYHVGKGRTETILKRIGTVYVCGKHEIPVTIREIKKG